jgi:hypothetical protein
MSIVTGLQFRYVYFLCPDKERDALLVGSTEKWRRDKYPKTSDCKWKIREGREKGSHVWVPLSENAAVFTAAFDVERKHES